jgi:tyrosyl-DNA phosphodiesterase 2
MVRCDVLEDNRTLSVGIFDAAIGKWVLSNPLPEDSQKHNRLTFATFNIWFGEYYAQERYQAIANLLETHRPDFIVLQEVMSASLEVFLSQQWIREGYFTSDIDGSTLGEYGVLILSRLPLKSITLKPLPSFMGRGLLLVEADVNGTPLRVGTVHLESRKTSSEMRGFQLRKIFAFLKDMPNVVIMGDFNFCASWHKENDRIDLAYHDVWELLRGDEPGYTEDTGINQMRYLIKGKHKQVRFDRILFKGFARNTGWVASSIDLLGTEPIAPELPHVFPSDHFGLVCQFSNVSHSAR